MAAPHADVDGVAVPVSVADGEVVGVVVGVGVPVLVGVGTVAGVGAVLGTDVGAPAATFDGTETGRLVLDAPVDGQLVG